MNIFNDLTHHWTGSGSGSGRFKRDGKHLRDIEEENEKQEEMHETDVKEDDYDSEKFFKIQLSLPPVAVARQNMKQMESMECTLTLINPDPSDNSAAPYYLSTVHEDVSHLSKEQSFMVHQQKEKLRAEAQERKALNKPYYAKNVKKNNNNTKSGSNRKHHRKGMLFMIDDENSENKDDKTPNMQRMNDTEFREAMFSSLKYNQEASSAAKTVATTLSVVGFLTAALINLI